MSAGETNIVPGVQHRYRIYRRDEGTGKDAIAGEVTAGEAGPVRFVDSSFEWEKTYLYRTTAVSIVSRPGGSVQVEGEDSIALRVVAHDVFPPAVPTGLQAVASGEGQKPFVDLIWAPDTNADLAGYNVYRRDVNGTAAKLNSELVKSPAYRDAAVAAGAAYLYSVSAVDVRGNESAKSEEASETLPAKN
jgi:fibronectin type 3 domain-containing protein